MDSHEAVEPETPAANTAEGAEEDADGDVATGDVPDVGAPGVGRAAAAAVNDKP